MLKKTILTITVISIICNMSYAMLENGRIRGKGGFTPVRLCIVPGAPALPDAYDVYGLNLGCFYSFTYKKQIIYGLDLGFITESNVNGIQLSFINVCKKSNGLQLAFANAVEEFDGLQIGVFNDIKNSCFFQIGLVNKADVNSEGFQLGLVNLKDNGMFWIMPFINWNF